MKLFSKNGKASAGASGTDRTGHDCCGGNSAHTPESEKTGCCGNQQTGFRSAHESILRSKSRHQMQKHESNAARTKGCVAKGEG